MAFLAVLLVALCAPSSSAGGAADVQSATASTGTLVSVRFPLGACAYRRTPAYVTVTDAQRRPLARVRVSVRAGTRISPAAGVTATTGKVTLQIVPVPFRRGPLVLTLTAAPTDRAAVTKQFTLRAC